MIQEAVAITRYFWGDPPKDGFITFVDTKKVRAKANPGHCYIIAGWRPVGESTTGLLCLQLLPEKFPAEIKPFSLQTTMEFGEE